MRIDRLSVQNFRCFGQRTVDLHPRFNVLIGDNGSGKTAVLEALVIAAGSWFLGIKGQSSRAIRHKDVRLVGHAYEGDVSFEEQYPVSITAEGSVGDTHLAWERALSSPKGRTTHSGAKDLKRQAAEADASVRAGESVLLPVIAYYSTARLWLQPRDTKRRRTRYDKQELSRLAGYRDSIDPRLSAREFVRWMERQDRISYHERQDTSLYRLVRAATASMIEEATDVRYDPSLEQVLVFFKDEAPQPFDNLSDGQRSMLALVGDLVMRMARLNPHLGDTVLRDTPGVVLIDELDLHLHPKWQRHVVDDLKRVFPAVQFVTTTHSPFIIQTLDEGELHPLDAQPTPKTDNLSIETIAEGLMGVEETKVGPKYLAMVNTAKDYLLTLEEAAQAPEDKLEDYKKRLAQKIDSFADNPAFQAFLELERIGKLGE